ncbi:energy transducer TonB [Prevotella sp. E9-3]|uniref:energy transducer TonB n=1 Tax=Prevotella sp. E9-3 TaxID=2913621 RepID=UPI001EDA6DA9|nr:energy transducer TonB [Prevotella sp. E9-3]UKK48833.1 energy transducer TonB [Prevotella sp. E9-3]
MSKIDLLNDGWVDLVFEGKNQAYGAYQLRKETGKRNVKALVVVILTIAAIFIIAFLNLTIQNALKQDVAIETDVELSKIAQKKEAKVERKEPVKVEVEQKVVEKVKSSVKFTAPEIKKDEEVKPEDEIKSQDDLAKTNTAIGTFDVKGNDEAEGEVLKAKEVIADEPKVEEQKVFDVVEQMPEFPGGQAALLKWISDHIKYPAVAEENGIQGRVVATFVVERDGSVTDVKIARSIDPSLDKEAIRVLKQMPKWIPGKQNGSAVRVKYTVPVTFKLQ